jgi:hypothetical protein
MSESYFLPGLYRIKKSKEGEVFEKLDADNSKITEEDCKVLQEETKTLEKKCKLLQDCIDLRNNMKTLIVIAEEMETLRKEKFGQETS